MFYVSMYNQRARLIEPKHPLTPPPPSQHLFFICLHYIWNKKAMEVFFMFLMYITIYINL